MPGANYEQPEVLQSERPSMTGDQQETVREITLTDKLNKKLLEAFLQRINQVPDNFTPVEREQNSDEFTDNDFS